RGRLLPIESPVKEVRFIRANAVRKQMVPTTLATPVAGASSPYSPGAPAAASQGNGPIAAASQGTGDQNSPSTSFTRPVPPVSQPAATNPAPTTNQAVFHRSAPGCLLPPRLRIDGRPAYALERG